MLGAGVADGALFGGGEGSTSEVVEEADADGQLVAGGEGFLPGASDTVVVG